MITFFITLILATIVTSLFILGFYIATRHWKVTNADGTEQNEGYLLKKWSIYWEGIAENKKQFFKGDNLKEKLAMLPNQYQQVLNINVDPSLMAVYTNTELSADNILEIEQITGCKVLVQENFIFLYEEIPVYRYPTWVSNPLSGCPKCMSSVFGSLLYWIAVLRMPSSVWWDNTIFFDKIAVWLFFIVILIPITTYLHSKIENNI